MLCDMCKKRPATMRLTRIINNKKHVLNICHDCSTELSIQQSVTPNDGIGAILSGLMGLENIWNKNDATNLKCSVCGMTETNMKKSGKLGCSECYNTFISDIRPLLRKLHGNCVHIGLTPNITPNDIISNDKVEKVPEKNKKSKELIELKQAIKVAIDNEEYEKAAQLRDKIKEIEEISGGDSNEKLV